MLEDYVSVQRFEVKFDAAKTIRHKTLYANGRMQVRVLVLISGGDAEANEVSLYGHSALQTLRLISYNGARPLEGDWSVSTRENRYAHDMSGGLARVTDLVPATDNRISDPADSVQVFEFWVSSSRPGSLQIAAEITFGSTVVRSNGVGEYDSSITLESVSPRQYPLNHFKLGKYRDVDLNVRYDSLEQYTLGLSAEGRLIHLLDWFGDEVAADADDAVLFFSSGNVVNTTDGRRTYYGYIAPVYGTRATLRGPKGYMSAPVNQERGKLSILKYQSADYQSQPERNKVFALTVLDEYGTEHRLLIKPDIDNRSFTLG
ncbi:hypothetical protein [Pseudomonas sp. LB3P14]